MCHNPARLFSINKRGFLREGYQADITIVKREPWVLSQEMIQSKCGWSPMTGHRFGWKVMRTLCNGHTVWKASEACNGSETCNGSEACNASEVEKSYRGEEVSFR